MRDEGFFLALEHKYLEPGESLAEVLFGLIMSLTFTLGAGLIIRAGPDAVRELLLATIGCNIAWGVIDGALYITGRLFERGRLRKVGDRVRAAPDEAAAVEVMTAELEELLGRLAHPDHRDDMVLKMTRHVRASEPQPVGFERADFKGALASFLLVFLASLPAALPFLFIDDATLALRTSNGILIGLLFIVGFRWARHTALSPWLTGLALMFGGLAMVAIAIALGG